MIITIGGNVGAGKTTLAARLSKALGYDELYIGGIMREIAAERGITIEDFYARLKQEPELERSIDERQRKLLLEKDNLVVQGRMAWFFAHGSPFRVLNVFLAVEPEIGARRTAERPENIGRDVFDLVHANGSRAKEELERYRDLYAIENFLDDKYYDFILDTTYLTEDETLQKTLAEVRRVAEIKKS